MTNSDNGVDSISPQTDRQTVQVWGLVAVSL